MTPAVETYLFVPGYVLLAVAIAIALGVFGYRVFNLYRFLTLGKPEDRLDRLGFRIKSFLLLVFGQRRVIRDPLPGAIHFVIFWGFIIIAIGTLQTAGLAFDPGFSLLWIGSSPLFSTIVEFFAIMVTVAVVAASIWRWVARPMRIENNMDAGVILAIIFALMITKFSIDGLRIAAGLVADPAWTPASMLFSNFFTALGLSTGAQTALESGLWWTHILLLLGFLAYIPYSKHLHLLGCPANDFLQPLTEKGKMTSLDIENEESFGVSSIQEFTWKQLLDLYACTECGRCREHCPAFLSQKPLSPKKLVHDLRVHLINSGPALLRAKAGGEVPELPALIGDVISEDEIWSCTTCRNCQEHCPVFIEHIPKIIDMRRSMVLMESNFPPELKAPFRSLETKGNPWEIAPSARAAWAEGLGLTQLSENPDVDIVYWVGCYGSLDDRSKKVARSFATLLQAAGVKVGILGTEEKCCGEPARMAGNEYLFQMLATENIEYLKAYNIKKVVTTCPHCFNVLRNHYPDFGSTIEVVHHTEYLVGLIAEGRLKPATELPGPVTYHDPCYLGRYHNIYDQPRSILSSIPGLRITEMERTRDKSFCCGGGGGRVFMEEHLGQRINQMRMEQAKETGAGMLAVACPFCLTMMEDAGRVDSGEKLEIVDIAEVLCRSVISDARAPAVAAGPRASAES